jgi:hypothetical protein
VNWISESSKSFDLLSQNSISHRYFDRVSELTIDSSVLTGNVMSSLNPEDLDDDNGSDEHNRVLFENQEEAERARRIRENLRPEAPKCECFSDGRSESC